MFCDDDNWLSPDYLKIVVEVMKDPTIGRRRRPMRAWPRETRLRPSFLATVTAARSAFLFFDEPAAYLARIENPAYMLNTFNADIADAYTVDRKDVGPLLGHDKAARFNSGLGLAHRASLRTEWIEEFLGLPGMIDGFFWRIEQTLFALCSSRFGVELLPDEYTLSLEPGIKGRPFRHYVGCIRHLMYSEGMAHLSRRGLLDGRLAVEANS